MLAAGAGGAQMGTQPVPQCFHLLPTAGGAEITPAPSSLRGEIRSEPAGRQGSALQPPRPGGFSSTFCLCSSTCSLPLLYRVELAPANQQPFPIAWALHSFSPRRAAPLDAGDETGAPLARYIPHQAWWLCQAAQTWAMPAVGAPWETRLHPRAFALVKYRSPEP